jgi:hypothetical protein
VYAFVFVIDIARPPCTGLYPFTLPLVTCRMLTSPQSNDKVCYNEMFLIHIKQICRIRELLKKEFVLYLKTFSIFWNHFPWAETTKQHLLCSRHWAKDKGYKGKCAGFDSPFPSLPPSLQCFQGLLILRFKVESLLNLPSLHPYACDCNNFLTAGLFPVLPRSNL